MEPEKNKLEGEIKVRRVSEAKPREGLESLSARREGYEKGLRALVGRLRKLVLPRSVAYVMRRLGILDAKYGVSSRHELRIIKGVDGPDVPTAVGLDFTCMPVSSSKADKLGSPRLADQRQGHRPHKDR